MALSDILDSVVDLTEATSEAADTKLRGAILLAVVVLVLFFLLILFYMAPYFALAVSVLVVVAIYLLRDDGGDLI